mmetsp:Transcript_25037/g.72426  ORF Transcript_25037/g.72426 Transcript_25037/m.72426 type:complete len:243 (+) Transcript_25037:690-1418(+)
MVLAQKLSTRLPRRRLHPERRRMMTPMTMPLATSRQAKRGRTKPTIVLPIATIAPAATAAATTTLIVMMMMSRMKRRSCPSKRRRMTSRRLETPILTLTAAVARLIPTALRLPILIAAAAHRIRKVIAMIKRTRRRTRMRTKLPRQNLNKLFPQPMKNPTTTSLRPMTEAMMSSTRQRSIQRDTSMRTPRAIKAGVGPRRNNGRVSGRIIAIGGTKRNRAPTFLAGCSSFCLNVGIPSVTAY